MEIPYPIAPEPPLYSWEALVKSTPTSKKTTTTKTTKPPKPLKPHTKGTDDTVLSDGMLVLVILAVMLLVVLVGWLLFKRSN
jgi:hypothetical protein